MTIYAEIELAPTEKAWIRENAEPFLRNIAFRRRAPEYALEWENFNEATLSPTLAAHAGAVQQEISYKLPSILSELNSATHVGMVEFRSDGSIHQTHNELLGAIFSMYDPEHLGRFDYHGPQRSFGREGLGGISLSTNSKDSQKQQSALYNYSAKYQGVKTELSSAYVRQLISKEAGGINGSEDSLETSLIETVHEMFARFFPGKRFLGVQPTDSGSLTFDVETPMGRHDINELSSGEKELIYGYLRLRNEAPTNSVIMLDEPELHLNPKLTKGLPEFYRRHIGAELNNQLWLVTHSDSILRQAVEIPDFDAFHMHSAGTFIDGNQIVPVEVSSDLDRAVIDLIGDLPGYTPNGTTVFLEGGGDSHTDENIIRELFPQFAQSVNLISTGDKRRVRLVRDLLERAVSNSIVGEKVFSIVDRDDEVERRQTISDPSEYIWDRYHIESYLLEAKYVGAAAHDLNAIGGAPDSDSEVETKLKDAAIQTLELLVAHEIENTLRTEMRSAMRIPGQRNGVFDAATLANSVGDSSQRIQELINSKYTDSNIASLIAETRDRRNEELSQGSWKSSFRGRDVLKRFVAAHVSGVRYEPFRNLIVSKMAADSFQPLGMKAVIDQIVAAQPT